MVDKICTSCVHYHDEPYNMIGSRNAYCKKGTPSHERKKVFRGQVECLMFSPTLEALQTPYLRELYYNFIALEGIQFSKYDSHVWRIVDDWNRHKRISGNNDFYLKFKTEDQLDRFYEANKAVIKDANIRKK